MRQHHQRHARGIAAGRQVHEAVQAHAVAGPPFHGLAARQHCVGDVPGRCAIARVQRRVVEQGRQRSGCWIVAMPAQALLLAAARFDQPLRAGPARERQAQVAIGKGAR